MRVEFRKITKDKKPFTFEKDGFGLDGTASRISNGMVKLEFVLSGPIELPCDRCAETVVRELNEEICLFASDGTYSGQMEQSIDVVEFYQGFIEMGELLESELSLIRSDYLICSQCIDLEIDAEE